MAFGNYPNYYNPYSQNFTAPLYQNQTQPQMQPIPPIAQQSSNGIIWVQGEAGAKAYPVAPGNNVLLMDSESKTMYLKGADQSGIPSMRIFDYTERNAQAMQTEQPKIEYVTRDEFSKLVNIVKAMKEGNINEQSDI